MSDSPGTNRGGAAGFFLRNWLGVLLTILVLIFVVQNGLVTNSASVQVLFWTITMPNWLLLAIVFFLGWFVGWLFSRRGRRN